MLTKLESISGTKFGQEGDFKIKFNFDKKVGKQHIEVEDKGITFTFKDEKEGMLPVVKEVESFLYKALTKKGLLIDLNSTQSLKTLD